MSGEKEKSNLDEPLTNSSQNSTSLLSANPNLTNDNPENNEVAENAVPTTAANHHPETDHNSNHPKAIVKPNNDKDLREGEFSDLSADQLLAEVSTSNNITYLINIFIINNQTFSINHFHFSF